jgi:apolipoprotein N-acyltransferase
VNSAIASFFVVPGTRRSWLPLTAILLAVVLQLGTPLHRTDIHEAASQTAVMMQENLEVGEMARQARPLTLNQELDTFFGMSLAPVAEGTGSHRFQPPTVVIWPEAPSHFQSDDPAFRYAAMVLARTIDAPAILGSLGVDRSSQSERGYYLYDSASLFDATGRYRGRYDKIHLVPWGEYVPFQQVFAFAHKLTEGVGNMDRGTARSVFAAGGHSYGVFICYESIFGEEVRQFAQNGAQVLVNISDDGWYGDSGAPWQHLNMTRMRAIENHRWLLLDTNTGVTTSIDPQGREVAEAPRHVRGAYSFPFAFQSGTTLYTRWGDWFAWCCAFVSLVAISLCLSHKVSKP